MSQNLAIQKAMGYISPPAVAIITGVAIIGGYILGWYVNDNPDMGYICLLAGLIMVFALKWPVQMWTSWRHSLSDEQITTRVNTYYKPSPNEFDETDFDAATQSILAKAVKKARKEKAPVTVPMLLGDLMKNVK